MEMKTQLNPIPYYVVIVLASLILPNIIVCISNVCLQIVHICAYFVI